MLWTLWRSISVEFWRLLLLTTAVLVATIAFAITIKPLADGKLAAYQDVYRAIVTRSLMYRHDSVDITNQVVSLMNSEYTP